MKDKSRIVPAFWLFMFLICIWPVIPIVQHQVDRTLLFWALWGAVGLGTICGIIYLAKKDRDDQRE
jgi:hypothetical protein